MKIEGIDYDIDWVAFKPGTSLFFPAMKPAVAKEEITWVTHRMRIKVKMKTVIYEGVQGVRVWRV